MPNTAAAAIAAACWAELGVPEAFVLDPPVPSAAPSPSIPLVDALMLRRCSDPSPEPETEADVDRAPEPEPVAML